MAWKVITANGDQHFIDAIKAIPHGADGIVTLRNADEEIVAVFHRPREVTQLPPDTPIPGGPPPGWLQLQADVKQILERTTQMNEALDRLTASVASVGTAVSQVADAVRAHPAAANDSGQLNVLADQLDKAATELLQIGATVSADTGSTGTASGGGTGTTTPPVTDPGATPPPVTDPGAGAATDPGAVPPPPPVTPTS